MTEILNCRCCGRKAQFYDGEEEYWFCGKDEACGICGPNNDADGAKWNYLNAPREIVKVAAEGTVRVRIPIVVDTEGNWAATAWSTEQASDAENVSNLLGWNVAKEPSGVHWITADIPLPQPAEIKGVVSDE